MNAEIKKLLQKNKKDAVNLLAGLIRFPSLRGRELKAQLYLKKRLDALSSCDSFLAPINDAVKTDRDYAFDVPGLTYKRSPNLVVLRKGKGCGRSVILNAHIDVVSAEKWPAAFQPRVKGGFMHGRGACDDKGNIVVVYLALKILEELGLMLDGDLTVQVVVDEEAGGNGTLALIKAGYKADGAVVLEPTEMDIHPAVRGAVWFRITCEGKSAHSGMSGVSAIEKAFEAMEILKKYRKKLAWVSRGNPYFKDYDGLTPLNIGVIRGGEWPSTVAPQAVMEGMIGFLTNKRKTQVMNELRRELKTSGSQWLRDHHEIQFPMLNNDAYEIPADEPLVRTMESSCQAAGVGPEIKGMPVSCDAWLYKHRANMPVIVFGAGSLNHTHCDDERIEINCIMKAAEILTMFLIKWCGCSSLKK